MLQQRRPDPANFDHPDTGELVREVSLVDELDRVIGALRRQMAVITAAVVAGIVVAGLYLLVATPLYTSSVSLLLGTVDSKLITELSDTAVATGSETDILSQVELVRSEPIALRVVDKLDLVHNPRFGSGESGVLDDARAMAAAALSILWFSNDAGQGAEPVEYMDRTTAAATLLGNLTVSRVGRTNVVYVGYTSADPELAAKIAAAYGEAFLADQIDTKYAAARSASSWLESRIEELKKKALESDLAVQQFRAKNNLIAADGVLVSDQTLADLSRRLVEARAATAQAQARYDRLQSIISSGDTEAVVTDALESGLITGLRTQYLEAAKRESEIRARLGPNHESVLRFQQEMAEISRQMFDELRRIAQSYRSEVQVAKLREQSLASSVDAATGVSASGNETMVQLRELERESDTYRTLYETVLKQYQEALQQTSFPVADSRIISTAKVPGAPSAPRSSLALAVGIFLGGAVGVFIGGFREFRDRSLRTVDQVREELGLEFIGLVPALEDAPTEEPKPGGAAPRARMLHKVDRNADYVVRNPASEFAETMWGIRHAADTVLQGRRPQVIGVVSLGPGEGKSTVSVNFAETMAQLGSRTLLIDADLRNPGLTRAVASHARVGLAEVIRGQAQLKDAIFLNLETRLAMLPAYVRKPIAHPTELLASEGMADIINQAARVFDHIVVDLPPIGPVRDARVLAPRLDAVVLVVEWGRTSRRSLKSALKANPQIAGKCIGVILNRVDLKQMALYGGYNPEAYQQADGGFLPKS